ncbi:hypothetical protein [Dyella sp. 2RAB6]|uniref:hypothetical protein n=1 Tax=Dyella sp. 2RAB6 TaxID=3232992 RepID=UPI003F92C030
MLKHPVIQLGDLRRVINGLLEHAERVHGPELALDRDYFWQIGSEAVYDVQTPITEVREVGSLGDSWEFLLSLLDSDIKEDGPSLMLMHAAPLLRYIAETIER